MKTAKSKNNRIQKWALYLDQFKYDIQYIQGKDNQVADFLSRVPENNVVVTRSKAKPVISNGTITETNEQISR